MEEKLEEKKENDKKQKKLPIGVKLLLFPFELILVLLLALLLWFTFCFFDRVKPVDALPPDYALYLRTDSVWDAAEPLLDLDATLIAMTGPELQQYRETYLEVKKSKLRKNFFVKLALSRRLDAALYGYQNDGSVSALAVLDAGFLSGALRAAPYVIPRIKALSSKLEISSNSHGTYYQLEGSGYFIIRKNLAVFSTSRELLEQAMTWTNGALYKSYEREAVTSKLREPMRILANGQNVLKLLAEKPLSPAKADKKKSADGNGDKKTEKNADKDSEKTSELIKTYLSLILPYLSEEEYTSLTFGITDSELNVSIQIPLNLLEDEHPVLQLLKRESSVPSLLPKFSDDVQYYTLISAGSLQELKDAAVKILPAEKDLNAVWSRSDAVSKIVFNRSLEDLLFSWTGDEFAVFGIEGKSEPVFAIKISDEAKRREVFDRVFSSYIIQSNDSLLVDGIRLPCVQLPTFILNVLQVFNVNVPKPYYLVKDDFIYLSQSPENLVSLNANVKNTSKLSGSENWKRVSSRQNPYSTLSLYYNLARSVPFFIKGNSSMSKILSLYNSGRFDLRIKDSQLALQLQASAVELESALHIPGFPIELENKSNAELVKSSSKKSRLVFWLENDSSVNSLDCGTFAREKKELPDLQYILAASEGVNKANGGEVWAVTRSGMVYLLNGRLEVISGYPVLTGVNMACPPFTYKDSVALTGTEGTICFISADGKLSSLETDTESGIKARPSVRDDVIAFYEKGFFGGIHIYKNLELVTAEGPLELDGIAYGSPCIFTAGGKEYVAMISQAGMLYVYDFDGQLLSPFPVQLDGVFYLNVEMADGYLFALSADGILYRIGLDGKYIKVKIPYFSAKSGRITVCDYDGKEGQEIFVSGEGNSLYGFSTGMELLPAFPLPGYGNPLFTDLNGDNKNDCLVITFDNKLSAAGLFR